MEPLRFALLGLGAGAAYVLLGQGIVLIYRGSGLLNFAQGGVAMIAAQIFYGLRDDHHVWTPAAMVISLACAAAIGALVQLVVMRRLHGSSPLTRLIAILAVLGVLQGVGNLVWNSNGVGVSRVVKGVLPTAAVRLGSRLTIGEDRIILFGLAVMFSAVLWVLYQRTRYGLATTAVAENQTAAVVLGWSPDTIGTINWVAGCVLAGLAGILLTPIAGLSVTALTLTVIPGLAAALVGEFSSFWLVLVGGLTLGVIQSEMERYVTAPGWADAAPFLLVSAVIILRGRALPLRGELLDRPIKVGTGVLRLKLVIPLVVGLGILVEFCNAQWALAISSSAIVGLTCLSLIVVTGYAGQISLAQLTIAGVGALVAGNLSLHLHLPFPLAVVLGTTAAALAGLIVGLPALRCRGANLAVITIGFSLLIQYVVFGNQTLTGGFVGVVAVRPANLFGLAVDNDSHPVRYTLMVILVFVLCVFAVGNLRRGASGRRLLAIRTNERAATSAGVHLLSAKLYAFTLASAIAGLAGALGAYQQSFLNIPQYTTIGSINTFLTTVIGGIGYLFGAVMGGLGSPTGGVFSHVLSYAHGRWANALVLYGGIASLQVLMFAPSGVADLHARQLRWLAARRAQRRGSLHATKRTLPSGLEGRAPSTGRRAGAVLEVRGMSITFGTVRVVSDVDLDIRPGEVVGLIGPNGAGKTSLIDAVSGFVGSSGSVRLDGVELTGMPARQRAREGIGRTFQSVELFSDMSVLDNIRVAAESRKATCYVRDLLWPKQSPLPDVAAAAITDLGLTDELDRDIDELPTGRRRMAGIARMLAGNPSVVLLDEPAAGLNDEEKEELAALIRHLAHTWGLAVLLIEHDVQFVTSVSDRMIALALGRVVAQGSADEVMSSPDVLTAYLGEPEAVSPAVAESIGTPS